MMDSIYQLVYPHTLLLLCVACLTVAVDRAPAYASLAEYGYNSYRGGAASLESGYLSDWPSADRGWAWDGRLSNERCIDIPINMSLCRDIGYKSMRLPNLLQHDTLQEAIEQSGQWYPLLQRQCHPDTRLFLCSLFSPVCLDRPIYPCRSLCEGVKSRCEEIMNRFGYPWPDMLNCDKFPPDNGLCIGMLQEQQGETVCSACSQPNTFEAIVDNYCSSQAVYRTKPRKEPSEPGGEKVVLSGHKIRKMKGGAPTAEQLSNGLAIYLPDSTRCECGLGHIQSPNYLVMGDWISGRFYAKAFHLYEKKNQELKRALRTLRKDSDICSRVGAEVLVSGADLIGEDVQGVVDVGLGMEGAQPTGVEQRRPRRRTTTTTSTTTTTTPVPEPEPDVRDRNQDRRAERERFRAERMEKRRQEGLEAKRLARLQAKQNGDQKSTQSPAPDRYDVEKQEQSRGGRSRSRERARDRRPRPDDVV